MRRQMNQRANSASATAPVWAGRAMRLDPFHLPMQFGYQTPMGAASVSVTENGVVMRRELPCGLPMSIALPLAAFEGVAARVTESDGDISVTLELLHADPDMCVPLLVSDALEDAAADWHAWTQTTGLPMVMIDLDGVAKPVDGFMGEMANTTPAPRRRSMTLRRRRPRIFLKRQPGQAAPRLRIHGRQVISEGI